MQLMKRTDFFIPDEYHDPIQLRRARLLVRACLLTSLFSSSYVALSLYFDFEKGVYLMLFNVIGFLVLPFLVKARLPLQLVGNIFIFIGGTAIAVLTYFSGGIWSAIYPWIISIPILALLVVGKTSGGVWGAVSFVLMVVYGVLALQGFDFPVEYNLELRTLWFVSILPGLLLILLVIAFVFETTQSKALIALEKKNALLESQNEMIASQRAELEVYVEEKDQIIGILAHDLKNPLFNISSLAGFLKEDPESVDRKKYIELMKQSSTNGLELIDKVLKMNAAEQKDFQLQLKGVRLNSIVVETLEMMKELADKKEVRIHLENNSTDDVLVSDKTYLKLILENLLSNAIKFSRKGMNIQVVISNVDNKLQVAVIDEGPGIKPEEERFLFKKFTRLSARPTAGESSTGLGLSLVKHYAEILQGDVYYQKSEEAGATFIVELPLQIRVA